MVYVRVRGKVAVSVPVADEVALAERVMEVELAIEAMVAPEGMPVPPMACPAARPTVLDTAVTVALPLVVVPVKAMGVVPATLMMTFSDPVGIGVYRVDWLLPLHPIIPALTAEIAISIHNTWLSLRRRRTQKARMPNGRKASTVLVAAVRTSEVLKPSGRFAGVETASTTVVVVTVPDCAGRQLPLVVVRHVDIGVITQLT